ncbi:uncharacterized protein C8Q71DRAFT_863809 [Rhodofomes roseus]|uniref:Uncharacterized protein n=1 Tax=Rhodofomes roseus TaxID=34475 RepID=A0ABQ8JX94_9APHY|nr:uncharacterized protein C8Q71DRAFT_863809 [Rhodofomes roseus]KAH9828693.1 hypothetical protein C8Q71DRAFT_863809 [Rhodofomes roseus]
MLDVEEHRFTMDSGTLLGSEWYIYDAIIFLVPLACNFMLEEDSKVSRLEDLIMLWKEIC